MSQPLEQKPQAGHPASGSWICWQERAAARPADQQVSPTRLPLVRQRARAGINGVLAKQLFDAQKLVVIRTGSG